MTYREQVEAWFDELFPIHEQQQTAPETTADIALRAIEAGHYDTRQPGEVN